MDGDLEKQSNWLWVGDALVPQNVLDAMRDFGQLSCYHADEPLAKQLNETSIAVVCPNGQSDDLKWFDTLLGALDKSSAVAVVLLPPDAQAARARLSDESGQFIVASSEAAPEQLASHLAAAAALQPTIRRLQDELASTRDFTSRATRTIEEIDEEMRLAARLQRDFLPRRLPEVGQAKFGVLYRPASWVSGDIYDVVRLDETHVGFYIADVVGHGMPAALLTMFIKKAMQTKRIVGSSYQIVPPEVSLRELNIDICEQDLPSCQFCTVIYCVLDTDSLMLTYARGGHPEPIVIHSDGSIERLWSEGSLLGIFPDEQFTACQYQLSLGDRLLLYSDGAEDALRSQPDGKLVAMDESLVHWANLRREEMLLHLASAIDGGISGSQEDDVTVLVMDLEG